MGGYVLPSQIKEDTLLRYHNTLGYPPDTHVFSVFPLACVCGGVCLCWLVPVCLIGENFNQVVLIKPVCIKVVQGAFLD